MGETGVAVGLMMLLLPPSRVDVTMTITERITAKTSTSPKASCHLTFASALLFAAVPRTVPGVVPGERELCETTRVPQFGQRLRREENVVPHLRHFTWGITGISFTSVAFSVSAGKSILLVILMR